MRSIFLLIFMLFSSVSLVMAGASPEATIAEVKTSIDNADQVAFDKAVNMESLVGQCIDVFLEDAQKSDQKTLPPALALMLSTLNMSEAAKTNIRKVLANEGAEFVRFGVRSGAFAGKHTQENKSSGMLSTLFSYASMGRKEITHIGKGVEESGAVYVPFMIKDHGNGNSYPVEAWLRQENGQWRVVGLRNVRTLMRIIRGESSTIQSL